MSHKSNAANSGLLAYSITTNPEPIQVSPTSGNPSMASMVITVSNNTAKPIYCKKLVFSFPIGTNAQDLTESSSGILLSSNPSTKWQIGKASSGVFTATPVAPSDSLMTTDGLSFQIFNIEVNKQVGSFTFHIEEKSSLNNRTFTNKNNTYTLGKFPYGFYVNNFAASAPSVDEGDPVILSWSGSDLAAYTIMYDKTSVDVTNIRTWTSPDLKNTTTFALRATVQEQGETVDTYLYVTVIVNNPDLNATTLQVLKTSNLIGATTIGSTLDVTGASTLAGVKAGSLNVTGSTALSTTAISGSLNATGTSTLADGIVKGQLQIAGTMAAIGAAQTINQGTYTAPTDGFAIGFVGTPNNNGKISRTIISGSSQGASYTAQGGNYTAFFRWSGSSGTAWLGGLQNSFTAPVGKGKSFSVSVWNDGNNEANAPTTFYWVPIGAGNVSAPERTGDAKKIQGLENLETMTQAVSRPPDLHDLDIADLFNVLDDVLGKHLDNKNRKKLQDAIRRIVYFETRNYKNKKSKK